MADNTQPITENKPASGIWGKLADLARSINSGDVSKPAEDPKAKGSLKVASVTGEKPAASTDKMPLPKEEKPSEDFIRNATKQVGFLSVAQKADWVA